MSSPLSEITQSTPSPTITATELTAIEIIKAALVLRSRPACHGIRRTVIDTARESFVFHFFCIILRLDPCQTRLLQLH